MDFYSIAFFSREGEGKAPTCHLNVDDSESAKYFPATIIINQSDDYYINPQIIFHLSSIEALVAFKNSVVQSYEAILRKRGKV